jgi:CYTH domain-containing protein
MQHQNNIHFEIERRFLIRFPNITYLVENADKTEIVQTYLVSEKGETNRVRKRGRDGLYEYTHTIKRRISSVRRIEQERIISKAEYAELLKSADPKRRSIEKQRWCLDYMGQIFEIDIFPFWTDRAIMELELGDEKQEIIFPPQIEIIKEVTNDGRYTNAALAKSIPYENI